MHIDPISPSSEQEIPLFPLNVVLFPGGILPLHIFEQRYKLMIQFCVENQSPFGVVLIKDGEEVGGHAEPHRVGTAVQIVEIDRLKDGRMNLTTFGQYRFEIIEIQGDQPYLVAKIRIPSLIEIENHENLEPIIAEADQLYQNYESLLEQLLILWKTPKTIPSVPRHLAYQIGMRLQIPLEEKQQLLEMFPVDQLLKREIVVLKRETYKFKLQLAAPNN
ncbi:MAG: LON peptidase substrate-binding domain-containing protein [Candidatus Poribacteria bacterium]